VFGKLGLIPCFKASINSPASLASVRLVRWRLQCVVYRMFVQDVWPGLWERIKDEAPQAVEHVDSTRQLTAESKASIMKVCQAYLRAL
jgi:hypothetical protein